MNPADLWHEVVVLAIFVRALEFLYGQLKLIDIPSWGVAIILFTIIVKSLTLPLTLKSIRSMRRMQQVQPMLQQLQKQHKGDKERLMQEQMALYKEHGVNPVAGCLPMIVQMPIWIALYSALFYLSTNNPEFGTRFLWIANLATPEFTPANFPHELPILAVLTGATQWATTRMSTQPSTDPQQQTMNQVMQFMPLMFIFFSLSVPAGLVLYWVASNVYQMVQQYFVTGWGQLLPNRAVIAAAPAPRSEAVAEQARRPDQPERIVSKGGRRRRNKRR